MSAESGKRLPIQRRGIWKCLERPQELMPQLLEDWKSCVSVVDQEGLAAHAELFKDMAAKLCLGWMGGVMLKKCSYALVLGIGSTVAGAYYLHNKRIIDINYELAMKRMAIDQLSPEKVLQLLSEKKWTKPEVAAYASLGVGLLLGLRRSRN